MRSGRAASATHPAPPGEPFCDNTPYLRWRKKSPAPQRPRRAAPLASLGGHALVIYLIHQLLRRACGRRSWISLCSPWLPAVASPAPWGFTLPAADGPGDGGDLSRCFPSQAHSVESGTVWAETGLKPNFWPVRRSFSSTATRGQRRPYRPALSSGQSRDPTRRAWGLWSTSRSGFRYRSATRSYPVPL